MSGSAVEQSDVHVGASEPSGAEQATETATDDEHLRAISTHRSHGSRTPQARAAMFAKHNPEFVRPG